MARNRVKKALDRAYRDTAFEVDHPDGNFTIRVGETSDRLDALLRRHGANNWAYVTACNPRSVQLGHDVNSQRQADLRNYLLTMGFTIFGGRGVPAQPGWKPEDSFLVLGITGAQATHLGVMLEQNAIVVGEPGKPARLMICELPEESQILSVGDPSPDIQSYTEERLAELWDNAEISGVWIRESDVPDKLIRGKVPFPPGPDILEGKISSQRLAALRAGKKPNAAEFRLWREAWVEWALSDEDSDRVPGYAVSKVTGPGADVRYALILGTGYSFSDVEYSLEGIFPSVEAAMTHVSASGWHRE